MSAPHPDLPPHYAVLRTVWTVLQVVLLLILLAVVFKAFPPGDLISDARDLFQ